MLTKLNSLQVIIRKAPMQNVYFGTVFTAIVVYLLAAVLLFMQRKRGGAVTDDTRRNERALGAQLRWDDGLFLYGPHIWLRHGDGCSIFIDRHICYHHILFLPH